MDNNKKKNILLGALIVGIISMTVAFAALTTRLSINGTANVAATSWNIHFFNWQKVTIETGTTGFTNTASSPEVNQLSMSDSNSYITKVENINVTLNQPGDTAKYTFEIVNDGTIAGKLSNFTKTDTTSNTLVDYVVNCYTTSAREGTAITTDYVLPSDGGKVYCYLQVTYKDQINGTQTAGQNQRYTQSAVNTSLSAAWTWVQSDTQASVATGSAATSGGNAATSGGNSQSGGNQSAYTGPYATDFSGTYSYVHSGSVEDEETGELIWENQIPNNMQVYLRKITTGDTIEVCGVFSGGTVCIPYDYDEVYGDFNDEGTEVYGFVAGKKAEMEAKDAICSIPNNETLECTDSNNGVTCDITEEDGAHCYKDNDVACTLYTGNDGFCY